MPQDPSDPPHKDPQKPSTIRFAALVFCFVYPLVTLLLYALRCPTQGWTIWQRNLIMVPIVVIAMVYVIVPFIQKRLKHWL